MKQLSILIAITACAFNTSFAQLQLGSDTVVCSNDPITLKVNATNMFSSQTYSVTSIPSLPLPFVGTSVSMTDDDVVGPIAIGFDFCFMGSTYNQFYIGSNGWISFSPNQPTTYSSHSIPSTNSDVPKNSIMGVWQDWHPGLGGDIKYTTVGTAPFRRLIVSFVNIPMYSCNSSLGTFQFVLYESTNWIDNTLINKPNCPTWQGGLGTQGLHNAAGTVAYSLPNRNSSSFTAVNEAVRFAPNAPLPLTNVAWYDDANNLLGHGDSLVFTPTTSTSFSVSTSTCGGSLLTDTIRIDYLELANTKQDVQCYGDTSGTIEVTPNLTDQLISYELADRGQQVIDTKLAQTGQAVFSNLPVGRYYLSSTLVNAGGCNIIDTFDITQPDSLQLISYFEPDYCNENEGYINVMTIGGAGNYQYNWSNGASTESLQNIGAGTYSLQVLDDNNCIVEEELTLDFVASPEAIFTPSDTNVSLQEAFINFSNGSTNADSYLWDFNDGTTSTNPEPVHRFSDPGIYTVRLTVTNKRGCSDVQYREIKVYDLDFFVPSAFKAGADGINGKFRPVGRTSNFRDYELIIVDRYGKLLFETTDPQKGWNGVNIDSGKPYPQGVYAYQFVFTGTDGFKQVKNGSVTLLY